MSNQLFLRICGKAFLVSWTFIVSYMSALAQGQYVELKGYDKASYTVSHAGKYMRTWLVAGPVSVSADSSSPGDADQEKAFKTDAISQVNIIAGKAIPPLSASGKDFNWQVISPSTDMINLDETFGGKDFVYAYAVAEIKSSAPANVMLAVGSDDGIKVWHNGKLVHDNWIPRGVAKDNDLVPLKLVKGSNQILVKVQDMEGGWGFVARVLDKEGLTDQLNTAASNGNLDQIKLLLEGGANVNAAAKNGLTPIMTARIAGRNDVVRMLLASGAKDQPVIAPEKIIDNLYSSLKEKEYPGVAVLVAQDEKVRYRKGFGYADIKNKIVVTPDTKFRIGSVTKQFTGAAILKLQENNLLSVNDKLSKFIPDFPRGDEVTIHHLLTHTSGIHSYTGKSDFLDRVTKTISPDSLIAYFKNDPYDFNPGDRFLYNNSGYFLLGYIISKVSGKSYGDYLKQTFFDPLGMTNTGVHYSGIKLDHEAKGYSKKGDKYEESLNWDMSWAGAAGALYSTVDDLHKWNQALYGGKAISTKSLDAALTPVTLNNNALTGQKYGYGLGLTEYRGMDIVTHSGGLHGFLSQLAYYPKEKMTVVMYTNTSDPEINFNPNKIAEAFLWNKLDSQSSFSQSKVKPANLEQFTGRYEFTNVGVMTVTTSENKLFAQLSGQPKFEIFPSSENEFFWKVVDARVKFLKNDNGEVNKAILMQNGMELEFKKLAEEKIVQIDPAILDNYTGKYKLNESIVVTIYKENNKLIAHPTNQQKLEMLPLSETEFVIKEINAKLSFVKGTDGKATKIKLNMNGTDTEMPRIE